MKKLILSLSLILGWSFLAQAQFGGLGKILVDKGTELAGGNIGKLIKQPAAITTNFKDVVRDGKKPPAFHEGETPQPLYLLPKATGGGFKLCAGFYEMTNKSYCLQAGTRGPSSGDGYMLAPVLGPKQEVVIAILKSGEQHPNVPQHDIQVLLWAIIARTRFADYNTAIKLTATTLLTPALLMQLEGGALGVLPANVMEKAKAQLPQGIQAIFEAENNIRRLAASGNATYEEIERYAMLAGMVPAVDNEFPSGTWALHPDGYYIRFIPKSYSTTRTQIYVPQELADSKPNLVYNAPYGIACPANTGAQRLIQTNEPLEPNYNLKLTTKCFN
ncbi:hypothetical protein ACXZ1K_02190 [Pedobacter sp. PWIIR3]